MLNLKSTGIAAIAFASSLSESFFSLFHLKGQNFVFLFACRFVLFALPM